MPPAQAPQNVASVHGVQATKSVSLSPSPANPKFANPVKKTKTVEATAFVTALTRGIGAYANAMQMAVALQAHTATQNKRRAACRHYVSHSNKSVRRYRVRQTKIVVPVRFATTADVVPRSSLPIRSSASHAKKTKTVVPRGDALDSKAANVVHKPVAPVIFVRQAIHAKNSIQVSPANAPLKKEAVRHRVHSARIALLVKSVSQVRAAHLKGESTETPATLRPAKTH